jgi:pectate lyase
MQMRKMQDRVRTPYKQGEIMVPKRHRRAAVAVARIFLLMIAVDCIGELSHSRQLAFPTAEGYGRSASGGRGGDVYHVTNLNDQGIGSLRYGIRSAQGPRTIVFALSGTIMLNSPLIVDKSYLTIAGQTATAGGITLGNATLIIKDCHDVVIRYLRIRVGDRTSQPGDDADGLQTTSIENSILDHLSISWGIDSNHDSDFTKDVTIQWCISAEPLNHSTQLKEAHAMCSSYMNLRGPLSVHHNIYATGRERHPTLGATVEGHSVLDFRNNLIYNWTGTANFGDDEIYAINNYFKPGPETFPDRKPIAMKGRQPDAARGFMTGNVFEGNDSWTRDNYAALDFQRWLYPGSKYQYQGDLEDWKLPSPRDMGESAPHTFSAVDAYEQMLNNSGASRPRDAVDRRIINDIRQGTGRVIDSQEQVGGWPRLPYGMGPRDTDRDGMPDEWERDHELDPQDPEDRNADHDGDGYTNVEEYLNELAEPTP